MLGVVLGVAALIAMTAVSEGARRVTVAQIEALGTRNILVECVDRRPSSHVSARAAILLNELCLRCRSAETPVACIVPMVETSGRVHSREGTLPVRVVGTTRAYQTAFSLPVDRGRFLADIDDGQVAVLGATVARELFPKGSAVDDTIRIGHDVYAVVGSLPARSIPHSGSTAIPLMDSDSTVFVPLGTVAGTLPDGTPRLTGVVFNCTRSDHVANIAAMFRRFLDESGDSRMFNVTVPQELLRQARRAQTMFNAVMLSIAAVGLVVGGIGIMNVMLASVAERVHEVGIRRAVGARQSDVMLQFMVEATVLCLAGGAVGVAVGAGAAALMAEAGQWPVAIRVHALVAGLVVAGLTGLVFGTYPAYVASRMPPAEAIGRT